MVASIRKHGCYPITIDKDGAVVDGKIRLMAARSPASSRALRCCPMTRTHSTSSTRRTSPPEPDCFTNRGRDRDGASIVPGRQHATDVINRLLVETAVFVLHHAPHLFDAIRDGVMTLDGAKRTVSADLEKRPAICSSRPRRRSRMGNGCPG